MGKRKLILVVDDDEQILIVWRGALQEYAEQWQVETAQSADKALKTIRTTGFDLLVTDLRMPGMDGCELTAAARSLVGDAPVIWITAYPEIGAQARAEELGVCRILNKPVTVAQIRQVVAKVLGGKNQVAGPVASDGKNAVSALAPTGP